MGYLIFLSPGEQVPGKHARRPLSDKGRVQAERLAAVLLERYDFKNVIVIAEGAQPSKETGEIVSRVLRCDFIPTYRVSFSYYSHQNYDNEGLLVLSYLLEKQKEKGADAVLFVAKGAELYYTEKQALKKFPPALPHKDNLRYFHPNTASIMDLKHGLVAFIENTG